MTLRDQLARFHDVVTGRAPLASALDLVDGGDIDAHQRLRAYEYAYTARIGGVLAQDYPKLAHLVGDSTLRGWTSDYLRAHPPSNFSLREVGAPLAAWLTVPAHADLARLERARIEVFDGPDAPPLSREDLADFDPAEFPSLPLVLVPSSRLVTLTTNADDVWDAIENDQPPPASSSAARTVLVWRRDYQVIHRTLADDEARILPTMIAGTTFGAACELLDEETAAERAFALLVKWLDAGILARRVG